MDLVATSAALLGPVDGLRRRWLRLLGPLARPLMVDRELRVAIVASAMMLSAAAATLLLPLWLLALGPIVWGVPHLVADLRYLVVGPGYHRRWPLVLLAGPPLVAAALGAGVVAGLTASLAAALLARTSPARRVLALALLAALALALDALGPAADVLFAHAHNFIAVALWWAWRPREGRLHWLPLALFAAISALLVSDLGLALVDASAGLRHELGGMGVDYQLARLTPRLDPTLGIRLVVLFAYAQAIHYAVWLHLIPDDDRARRTPPTFATSFRRLCADLGVPLVALAAALALAFAAWALLDLMASSHGYFRLARFHGHLELCAATLLLLERRR